MKKIYVVYECNGMRTYESMCIKSMSTNKSLAVSIYSKSKKAMKTTWDFIEKYYDKYDRCSVLAETLDLLKIVDGEALEIDSDAWKKFSKIKSDINNFFGGTLSEEELGDSALKEVHDQLNSNLSSLINAAITNFHKVNPQYQKDVAIATAYFVSEMEHNSSFFNIIDKAYELAIGFVYKYPPETKWGIENNLEYEETLSKFLKDYEKN